MDRQTDAIHVKHSDEYTHDDLYEDVCAFERALVAYRRAIRSAQSDDPTSSGSDDANCSENRLNDPKAH